MALLAEGGRVSSRLYNMASMTEGEKLLKQFELREACRAEHLTEK